MFDGLTTALSFILIIVLGYMMKKLRVIGAENFQVLSRIVVHLTLPCAIITNLNGTRFESTLLALIGFGLVTNVVLIAAAYALTWRKSAEKRAFSILTLSGFNIGNFAFPYVQAFLPPTGFLATALFDAGNALVVSGGAYAVAKAGMELKRSFSVIGTLKAIFRFTRTAVSSIAFCVYLIMIPLCLLGFSLPQPVTAFTGTIGAANTFLCMLMLGVGVEFHLNRERLMTIGAHLLVRYAVATVLALAAWYLLPFSHEVRVAMTVVMFAPTSTLGLVFTAKIGGDVALASNINSISILISVVVMTVLMSVL